MNPSVLILSYGNLSATEIVENILAEMNQPKDYTSNTYESEVVNYYKCDIRTKYYTTSVSLIPFDGKYDRVPAEVRKTTEALIVYFEPNDRSFIKDLSGINDFSLTNEIQLGFLITTAISDKPNALTFEDLKETANVIFDIVTLSQEDENLEETDKMSYAEIVEGLKNFVWSNVNIKGSSSSARNHSGNAEDMESQLNDFEKLLTTAKSLRSNTGLTRDEILNKAEEMAKVMASILNDIDSD